MAVKEENAAKGLAKGLTSYGDAGFSVFLRNAFLKGMGYSDDALDRPIIGIANTFSDFNPCHATIPDLVEAAKRGVMLAGGLPFEFPTISIHESFSYPTSMYLRNLMSMDTEEMVRSLPVDAVILIGGCDKTVPAQLMGAASAGVPAIQLVTGPMLTGSHRGERMGACTDCRRHWARFRSSEIDNEEIGVIGNNLVPTAGTCGVMGTASTMACVVEALGMMLPGGAVAPAVSSSRRRIAEGTGWQSVKLANSRLTPDLIMTPEAFENAIMVLFAIGGSTNAIIHITAIAGRLGIGIDLDKIDRVGQRTPVLVDLKPAGKFYMEDLDRAGGLIAVMRELRSLLHLDCLTVTGRTLGEEIDLAPAAWAQDVVRSFSMPLFPGAGIAVLKGNLAPRGAIIKQAAASPDLLRHTGRAVVFNSLRDLKERIDDPQLDVEAGDILVLRNAGPKGAPGMPEAGYIPIPKKLARAGVKDMIRISDARMSGTASGTIVLHVAPESVEGGALGLVQNGDLIRLDVPSRTIELLVPEKVLEVRREACQRGGASRQSNTERGFRKLFLDQILQADQGCDFAFLVPDKRSESPSTGTTALSAADYF